MSYVQPWLLCSVFMYCEYFLSRLFKAALVNQNSPPPEINDSINTTESVIFELQLYFLSFVISVSINSMIKQIYGCWDFPLFRVVNVTFLGGKELDSKRLWKGLLSLSPPSQKGSFEMLALMAEALRPIWKNFPEVSKVALFSAPSLHHTIRTHNSSHEYKWYCILFSVT